ncbi:hypothetical protein BDZ97DRAFT_512702 [Flammula alnicola]|nr:hypothetical protein BDZ97DRAFT_512702 [Flammula alnicola]
MSETSFDDVLPTPSTSQTVDTVPVVPKEIDPDFYFESIFVVFQVENCLFRVPTHLFVKESQVFAGMFRLPQPDGPNVEGSSSANPIIMPSDIRREDFRNLMKALYPLSVSRELSLSKAQWVSILKLSTMWYFLNLRKMAIFELERSSELTSMDKIILGRKFSVSSWVVAGFSGIIRRTKTITDDEAIDMDFITTVNLFRIRELRLVNALAVASVVPKIEEAFIDELGLIRAEEDGFKFPDTDIAPPLSVPVDLKVDESKEVLGWKPEMDKEDEDAAPASYSTTKKTKKKVR